MWCSNCHQDVPGIANAAGGRAICTRCQQPMAKQPHANAGPICDEGIELTEPVKAVVAAAPPRLDDWCAKRRARDLDRALRRPMHVSATAKSESFSTRRFDPPENLFEHRPDISTSVLAPHVPAELPQQPLPSSHSTAAQVLSWLVVVAGSLTVASGVGLMGWSLSANQTVYWNLALGLALGGQGALILGLVMVVSRLWRNSRYATSKLQEMHARLGQLQNTAETISGMRSVGTPAFYADLARGASPQVMLSNLKGQLDQLATRVDTGR